VQSLVNPPGSPKMAVFSGPEPGPSPEAWMAQATEAPGVWWQRWAGWQQTRAGEEHKAPARLGNRAHPAGVPAPGRYVFSG
jgi:polyhydroxyalkanoate synthase subunit PhaC